MGRREPSPSALAEWRALPRESGARVELLDGRWLVSPLPSAAHLWACGRLTGLLSAALAGAGRADLRAQHRAGVEMSAADGTALVPDLVVSSARSAKTALRPEDVLLVGEVWSPASSRRRQWAKRNWFARAGIPFFWSASQDRGGPVELATYRLDGDRYTTGTATTLGDGPVTITTGPVPVEVDLASLRVQTGPR